jgi:cytochrome c peroxidase
VRGLDLGRSALALFDSFATSRASARRSIARGQALFNSRTFTISDVAGVNDAVGGPIGITCSGCHNEPANGSDPSPNGQLDIGIGGQAMNFRGPLPAKDLPVFRLTCTGGASHPFAGGTVTTNDPSRALITGKCSDIGRRTIPPLRALAARAPYFSDGFATTALEVVRFYNLRFNIGLTSQEAQDLANYLNAL